jgi:N-acetylglucosamine-6-sulfatase
MRTELLALMAATGLTPQTDAMPMDEGIKTELPAQGIR